jgi:glycosyltransferase involved in cell wall biosynthesis
MTSMNDPILPSAPPAGPAAPQRRRILLITPFPPRGDSAHGGRVVAQLLSRLTDRHDVALIALREPDAAPIEPELARRCSIAREIPVAPHAWGGPAWRHRQRMMTMPITHRPARVAVAFSNRLVRAAVSMAQSWHPDIIQIEDDSLAYCAPPLRGLGVPVVLVCHDPGLGVARDLAAITVGRQRAAHSFEETTWRGYWRRTFSAVDQIITFTEADAALVCREVPGIPVEAIALGIDIPREPADPLGSAPLNVLFVGGYNHPPNADAALRLMSAIMPRVRERMAGLALTVVGAGPTPAMHAAAGPNDELTGWVYDVAPYVQDASLMAVPIELGGGMRVKLLEAMAAGKAVIASPRAAAGLDIRDGDQIVLADDDAAFVSAIVALLTDPARRRQVAERAREWAAQNLSWEARVAEYEAVYRRLLSARTSAVSRAAR